MNVGIITIWDDENYGNRLQNYAVQEVIKKATHGGEAVTIKYIHDGTLRIRPYLKRFFRRLKAASTYRCYAKGRYKIALMERGAKLRAFSEKYLAIDKEPIVNNHIPKGLNERYNYFVVGSDQVWNPIFGHATPVFLLAFADEFNRIAYAPSFGDSSLPEGTEQYIANMLRAIPHLSCREEDGSRLIKNLTGRNAATLIDPTLMLTPDEWLRITNTDMSKRHYAVVYLLGETSDETRSFIQKAAADKGLDVVELNDMNNLELCSIGIEDFLGYFFNADVIFTNSFHGTVFSVMFRKPFVVFGREPMNSRIETLLGKFGLLGRKYSEIAQENIYHIDYSRIDGLLAKERSVAMDYLRRSMGLVDEAESAGERNTL